MVQTRRRGRRSQTTGCRRALKYPVSGAAAGVHQAAPAAKEECVALAHTPFAQETSLDPVCLSEKEKKKQFFQKTVFFAFEKVLVILTSSGMRDKTEKTKRERKKDGFFFLPVGMRFEKVLAILISSGMRDVGSGAKSLGWHVMSPDIKVKILKSQLYRHFT